ncbi:Acyl-CoA N-acyltransferases (NAT) superfamily protein [Euphorbia peplus]|nr:Acyl-CoA N-acyltransferases (NAT) superfamily protein [Euphorbia peplus]
MSLKIAAGNFPASPDGGEVTVRIYEDERDKAAVEEMERGCEIGQPGKTCLVTDLLGDPICRVRHFSSHVMLVAEYGERREMVGVIRACIKTVTTGNSSTYVKLAYILGLRVSSFHRRLGIGTKLVSKVEEWCKQNGAEYSYMATDCTNEPSINLFTRKCCYTKFRTLSMLVQPIHAHYKPIHQDVAIVKLTPKVAELIYRKAFANAEFFPEDIHTILSSKLNLGTFLAMPKKCLPKWDPNGEILPPTYAILSVWNTKEVFKLQVKGASKLTYACCMGLRKLDTWMPWLRLPSLPDVFRRQFGVYVMHGLYMEGSHASRLMKSLCSFAYNMGRDDDGCGALVAEVGHMDPLRKVIPHSRRFSWSADLWCIKKLDHQSDYEPLDWTKSKPSTSVIFVDPRDV